MITYLPLLYRVLILVLCFAFGAFFGSAFNCLAYRMARGQQWSKGRSVCVRCGHSLTPLDLLPIFGYIFLRGKCRYCNDKISPRYLIAEVLLGVVFLSLLLRFGLTLQMLITLVLCCCLFCLSLVDIEIQIIPNRFLLIPAVMRLGQLLLESGLSGMLLGILPGLAFGGGLLVLSLVMDKVLGKETMGGGDIKLMAMLGLFFSFAQCLLLLVLACLLGIFIAAIRNKAKENMPFPFGPALSLAAWFTLLSGDGIINWYLSLF